MARFLYFYCLQVEFFHRCNIILGLWNKQVTCTSFEEKKYAYGVILKIFFRVHFLVCLFKVKNELVTLEAILSNFGEAGYRLEVRCRGEYQSFVT